ncbi:hypothetical protein [Aliivibrio fischeri]|uniref:hypothetical protein n=1 Tax=Aliivibrio fischeri TaxID=668 RepID=UPI00080EBA7E|nr:hypothetical protein [Aliivibrio fischeri]OCH08325.1 hypothetical protein A6E11_12535 [Aliivibrio fischeri]OCH27806.1 hypothetical protein A6E13_08645 [Aliivibrio fischeri]OCH59381.1 hypothetical protein A6D98_13470 [Aliivibrio fischeri]
MGLIYTNLITKKEAMISVLVMSLVIVINLDNIKDAFFGLYIALINFNFIRISLSLMMISSFLIYLFSILVYFKLVYSISLDEHDFSIELISGKNEIIDIKKVIFFTVNKKELLLCKLSFSVWFLYKDYMFSKDNDILCFKYNKKIYYISNKSDSKLKEYLYSNGFLGFPS